MCSLNISFPKKYASIMKSTIKFLGYLSPESEEFMNRDLIIEEVLKAVSKMIIVVIVGVLFPATTGIELALAWFAWVYFPCYDRYRTRKRKEREIKQCIEELKKETNNK